MRMGGNRIRAACPVCNMRGDKIRRYVAGSADVQMPISMTVSAAAALARMLAGIYDGGARVKSTPAVLNPTCIKAGVISRIPKKSPHRAGLGLIGSSGHNATMGGKGWAGGSGNNASCASDIGPNTTAHTPGYQRSTGASSPLSEGAVSPVS
ncbi:hypothetical protein G6F57_018933 [Rhizopus arrhizus]|nr:hypothetical protein G6F57_018933 [Rhizopus arrhizus]